jgi:hypothetical protein
MSTCEELTPEPPIVDCIGPTYLKRKRIVYISMFKLEGSI